MWSMGAVIEQPHSISKASVVATMSLIISLQLVFDMTLHATPHNCILKPRLLPISVYMSPQRLGLNCCAWPVTGLAVELPPDGCERLHAFHVVCEGLHHRR